MDLEKAYELNMKMLSKRGEKHTVLQGLQILAKYNDDTEVYPGHDQIWCCDFRETVEKMTEEDFMRMLELGWFESEEAWSKFC